MATERRPWRDGATERRGRRADVVGVPAGSASGAAGPSEPAGAAEAPVYRGYAVVEALPLPATEMPPRYLLTASMIAVIGAVAPLHTAGSAAGRSAEHAGRRRRRHLWRRDACAEPGAGSARPHVRGVCVHRRQKRIRRPRKPGRESQIRRRHDRALLWGQTPWVEQPRYRAVAEILLRQRPGEVGTSISGSPTDRAGLHGSV